jgi:hypothetical protein
MAILDAFCDKLGWLKAVRGKICKNPPKWLISELSFGISALSHVGST